MAEELKKYYQVYNSQEDYYSPAFTEKQLLYQIIRQGFLRWPKNY